MTMQITEVRIKLMEEPGERLKAFCSVTFDDCFVVRDLKIIDGSNGPFVAMPSRKLTSHCPKCGMKNHLRAGYCNQCGAKQDESRAAKDAEGRSKLYADIAHPINSSCREMIQHCVIAEYFEEIERAKLPGYVSRYDDFDYEFADAARNRPARFDQPHVNAAADRPHVTQRNASPPNHPRDKMNSHGTNDRAPERIVRAPSADRLAEGGFGAGIFPQ
jgi:stage V sporulation protein G